MSWVNTYIGDEQQGSAVQLRYQAFLNEQKIRQEADKRPLEFLCEDILQRKLEVSFASSIEYLTYKRASEEAKACIQITIRSRNVYGPNLGNWLQKLIDTFNVILTWYIQEVLKETCIDRHPVMGFELSVDRQSFSHLEFAHSENKLRRTIGVLFNAIYEDRNKNFHKPKKDPKSGKITIGKPNYNLLRDRNIKNARTAIGFYEKEISVV
tara:strand:- start:4451 stop:5080 length:630 start_codon:yes stop_codon:yes gene_type:complete